MVICISRLIVSSSMNCVISAYIAIIYVRWKMQFAYLNCSLVLLRLSVYVVVSSFKGFIGFLIIV